VNPTRDDIALPCARVFALAEEAAAQGIHPSRCDPGSMIRARCLMEQSSAFCPSKACGPRRTRTNDPRQHHLPGAAGPRPMYTSCRTLRHVPGDSPYWAGNWSVGLWRHSEKRLKELTGPPRKPHASPAHARHLWPPANGRLEVVWTAAEEESAQMHVGASGKAGRRR